MFTAVPGGGGVTNIVGDGKGDGVVVKIRVDDGCAVVNVCPLRVGAGDASIDEVG